MCGVANEGNCCSYAIEAERAVVPRRVSFSINLSWVRVHGLGACSVEQREHQEERAHAAAAGVTPAAPVVRIGDAC